MAESPHLLTAANNELGVVDLILSHLEWPEAQAVGIMAGLEAYAAKPLGPDVAKHYAMLGHLTSLKFVVGTIITSENADVLMYIAALSGHESIVRQCLDWGALNINIVMQAAARLGHDSIVRLCHEWSTIGVSVNITWAMSQAANGDHEVIVRMCREWGARDIGPSRAVNSR